MDDQQIFNEHGCILLVSTSGWTGRDRLRPSDIGKEAEDIPDIFTLGSKHLLPKIWEQKLQRPRGKIQSLMDRIYAKPFLLGKGLYFVADKKLMAAKEGLERIKEELAAVVEDLITNYDEIKAERIAEYPVLADAKWPTPKQIRRRYTIKWIAFQIASSEVKETDMETLIEAKLQLQADLKQAYAEYKEEILRDVQEAIIEVCEDLNKKLLSGEKITASTLKKPKRIIEDYLNVGSIFDLEEVKAEVGKLRNIIDTVDAKEVSKDWEAAQKLAETLKNLGDNIGDLSGLSEDGTVKRTIRKAA